MEDQYIIDQFSELQDHLLVAVFDGHSGTFAAEYCSMNLKSKIEESASWQAYAKMSQKTRKQNTNTLGEALVQAYLQLDDSLKSLKSDGLMEDNSGCTAVCCIITPTHLVCASVGDSRAVIGGKETTISLTEDHKPENPEECARIEKAGGFVADNRVLGELAMSRAIGDFRYKGNKQLAFHEQLVIAVPDVSVHERDLQNDCVLVVACDGVWDVLSNDEAVVFAQEYIEKPAAFSIHDYIQKANALPDQDNEVDDLPSKKRRLNANPEDDDDIESPSSSAEESSSDSESDEDGDHTTSSAVNTAGALISVALAKGSMDNISAVVVKFPAVNSLNKK
jgi:serine/threonine protein phosphatase PrpC